MLDTRIKLLYSISLLLLVGGLCFAQSPQKPELAIEIDRLYALDQKVQANMIAAYQNGASKEQIAGLEKIQMETFKKHIPLLKKIIQDHGFPHFDMVGRESSNNFFVMIQHSDSDKAFVLKRSKSL